jgi:hypothetical protein
VLDRFIRKAGRCETRTILRIVFEIKIKAVLKTLLFRDVIQPSRYHYTLSSNPEE